MKAVFKDALFGILVFIAVQILEFAVTLPFGEPSETVNRAAWGAAINRELLLTALPAALATFGFAWLLKTGSRREALRKGLVWVCVLALFYAVIGLENDNFDLIFGSAGVYALLACAFAGPPLYAAFRRLR